MLITLRRLFAVLLIPVFIVLFLGTLITYRVNATLLEPSFYVDTIRNLEVFAFMYETGIPAALDEAKERSLRGETGFDIEKDVPLNLGLTPANVSRDVERVLPADWLEEAVAEVLGAGIPYLTGESDTFAINIPVDDRVEEATRVARELIQDADIHAFLIDEVKPELEGERADFLDDLPYGLNLTTDQIIEGVESVVPEAWLKERVAEVIDEVTPYLLGRSDTFTVVIPLQDRTNEGLAVVEAWLLTSLDGGAYDYLLEDQIAPVARASLGASVDLPFGVTLPNAEVVAALGKVLPPDWVEARVTDAIGSLGSYLTAQADSFTLVIPLEDRAKLAAETLVSLADAKYEALYTSLPECSVSELGALTTLSQNEPPPCRPPLADYAAFKALVGLDVLDALVQGIVAPLPKTIELTEAVLFRVIEESSPVSIDDIREILDEGFVFTEVDLETLIRDQASSPENGQEIIDTIHEVRGYMRDGFSFDETQVRERLEETGDFDLFDDIRGWVDLGRSQLYLLVVLLAVIAAIIGLLGGRRWGTRLVWAGVPLMIAGGTAAVAMGPAASIGFGFTDDPLRELDVPAVFIDKLVELRDELEESFLAPMAFQSAIGAAIGFGMIVAGSVFCRRPKHYVRSVDTPSTPYETPDARRARSVVSDLKADLNNEQRPDDPQVFIGEGDGPSRS